jgi:hypothetical protein
VDEYVCVTLIAAAGEPEKAFQSRLTRFWSRFLRARPEDYARVLAESARFGTVDGRVSRQYMVGNEAVDALLEALQGDGIDSVPVDRDDTYSKYEAASPDWFQVPH